MPDALPRLLLVAATIMVACVPETAGAQAGLRADWQAPVRFLPPLIADVTPEAAAECLALAITYEAGFEPPAGQEAVAQVILNRVRHSAYPDTVCGVIWQGAQRRTGCQFTFTCDGSLRRQRSAGAMAKARQVAIRVLAGASKDHVRGATHYHADYVSPYWAPSLTRVRQISTHIFYRSPGAVMQSEGTPIMVDLSAPQRSVPNDPPSVAAPNPAIKNGEFAPWGLTIGPASR